MQCCTSCTAADEGFEQYLTATEREEWREFNQMLGMRFEGLAGKGKRGQKG